jgi:hypothetical protein
MIQQAFRVRVAGTPWALTVDEWGIFSESSLGMVATTPVDVRWFVQA